MKTKHFKYRVGHKWHDDKKCKYLRQMSTKRAERTPVGKATFLPKIFLRIKKNILVRKGALPAGVLFTSDRRFLKKIFIRKTSTNHSSYLVRSTSIFFIFTFIFFDFLLETVQYQPNWPSFILMFCQFIHQNAAPLFLYQITYKYTRKYSIFEFGKKRDINSNKMSDEKILKYY
jgi:hypothetical protein